MAVLLDRTDDLNAMLLAAFDNQLGSPRGTFGYSTAPVPGWCVTPQPHAQHGALQLAGGGTSTEGDHSGEGEVTFTAGDHL